MYYYNIQRKTLYRKILKTLQTTFYIFSKTDFRVIFLMSNIKNKIMFLKLYSLEKSYGNLVAYVLKRGI